jgi:glutaconyl-CoA/methylmalonyl-CoA decarboxylase subunit delta
MDDLAFGLRTTALGMGIVFGVLALLWGLLTLVARIDARAAVHPDGRSRAAAGSASGGDITQGEGDAGAEAPGAEPPGAAASGAGRSVVASATASSTAGGTVEGGRAVRISGAPGSLDPRLVAAITVAITRHEEARRLQAAPAMRSYWPGSLLFASRWVAAGRTRQGQSWRRSRR